MPTTYGQSMIDHTEIVPPSPVEETVPMHRRAKIEETQPTPQAPREPAMYVFGSRSSPRLTSTPTTSRRSCFGCLSRSLLLLALVAAAVVAARFVFWQWVALQPRTNVLILGLDRRPEQGNVVRSDTMILLSVYPKGPGAALLSIPRDLYVDIPGYGTDRINTAHFWGELERQGGGPALAMRTLSQDFGIPVHHYLRIDFDGFRAVVDAVGGIDVVVEEPIVDHEYPTDDYGTIRIEIPSGPQHMDGETALRYARSRHGSSDFDRAQRQQQILIALARRLIRPETWSRFPLLYRAVVDNVDTDLSSADLLLLFTVLRRVGPDGIEHQVIDQEMTQSWTTPSGGAVLLPRWEFIHPMVEELLTP
jgi:LCP family protein required for cell wall assembly